MQIKKDLINACLEGKRAAQNELYREVFSYLMNICMRYKNDYDTAGVSLNAIFLKILSKLDTFKQEESFIAWIKRIAVNHLIDEYRQHKRERAKLGYIEEESKAELNGSAAHEKEAEMNADYLIQMIKELPPLTAKVFNLYAIDGYKHREIGELLEMSENTSKWHLREARIKLKEKLKVFNETISL